MSRRPDFQGVDVTEYSDDDFEREARDNDRANGKPRPKGKIPYRPDRAATLPEWREWLSNALGLPPEVRVETILRSGLDDTDPLTIVLSNGVKMRCPHQRRLQIPAALQAFVASTSAGVAQPNRLSQAEAGDVFVALCVIGTTPGAADPAADLHEHLEGFVKLAETVDSSLDAEHRYATIADVKARVPFDRTAIDAMRHGLFPRPVVVDDGVIGRRYVRASEWITYLRHFVGQTVDPSALVARMAEIGSERFHPQAWNLDRSHKHNVVLYSLPEDL
jgi:hypothetical protein